MRRDYTNLSLHLNGPVPKRNLRRARSHYDPAMPHARHFPPPWTIEDKNDACFIVRDGNGQAVAYVYYEEEPGRRSLLKSSASFRLLSGIWIGEVNNGALPVPDFDFHPDPR